MAAIDNLEAAVEANTVAIDQAIARLDEVESANDARIQVAADKVAADAARLVNAVAPSPSGPTE